jgi:Uma2 family endonuclease
MSTAPREPTSARLRNFTRVDFDKMIDAGVIGEDERVELVGGAIVQMSPEGPQHAGTIEICAEALRRAFGAGFTVRVQHPLVVDPDDEPQPDLAVVPGSPRAHLAAHPTHAPLVVEVSQTSLAYDRREKALVYARAGMPDYWIVNLTDRVVEVHRLPSAHGYGSVSSFGPDEAIAPLAAPAASLLVASLLP